MANALYAKGRQAFANAGINLSADTIRAVLLTSGYTPSLATHQYLTDLGANTLGTAQVIAFTSDIGGAYIGGNVTFATVPAGTATYVALYKDTGVAGTSPLIGLIDTATGLPVTSTGSSFNISTSWDMTNGIFKL